MKNQIAKVLMFGGTAALLFCCLDTMEAGWRKRCCGYRYQSPCSGSGCNAASNHCSSYGGCQTGCTPAPGGTVHQTNYHLTPQADLAPPSPSADPAATPLAPDAASELSPQAQPENQPVENNQPSAGANADGNSAEAGAATEDGGAAAGASTSPEGSNAGATAPPPQPGSDN